MTSLNSISSLSQKAARKRDLRLKDFFQSEETPQFGPIYDELSTLEQRYSQKTKIGSGGMKSIYKVLDQQTNRYVAMACLHEDSSEDLYEPFLREARINAIMDHPNIMTIHDIGLNENGQPYFTMDLKSDNHLQKILNKLRSTEKESYNLRERLNIFLKICDAMAYAHSQGVIHLDLKPENIQVGDFGEVLVCDWGLGKIVNEPENDDLQQSLNPNILNNMTIYGEVKGTPGFMAPEQISGNNKTPQTDIHSLGAILYSILTLKKPYEGLDVDAIFQKTLMGQLPDIQQEDIPKSLVAVIKKAMAKQPEQRYLTITDMAKDIQAYLNGFATSAENAGFLKLLNLVYQRNKIVCCLILGFIILGLLTTTAFISNLEEQKQIALDSQAHANFLAAAEFKARKEADAKNRALQKMNQDYVKALLKQSIFMSNQSSDWMLKDPKMHKFAIDQLNLAKNLAPNDETVWLKRAQLAFIMQRFSESLKCIEKTTINDWPYLETAQTFSKIKQKRKKLAIEDFCQLLKLITQNTNKKIYRPLIDKMLAFDQVFMGQRTIEENIELTKTLIKIWNPAWTGDFSYDTRTRKLKLGGEHLKVLKSEVNTKTSMLSLLRFIAPLEIKFSASKLHRLSHLTDLNVYRLDISQTQIKDLSAINKFKSLKVINISKDQFTTEELKKIPSWILVEDSI
ncbi:MAG: serine/threonine protein kinase [Lentisphaerales bacterium]|nr:serine/threonine protein kinase [Lentisphaerales bacterium]